MHFKATIHNFICFIKSLNKIKMNYFHNRSEILILCIYINHVNPNFIRRRRRTIFICKVGRNCSMFIDKKLENGQFLCYSRFKCLFFGQIFHNLPRDYHIAMELQLSIVVKEQFSNDPDIAECFQFFTECGPIYCRNGLSQRSGTLIVGTDRGNNIQEATYRFPFFPILCLDVRNGQWDKNGIWFVFL